MRSISIAIGVALTCGACVGSTDEGIDPAATYTAFGHPFEPAAAVPVQAVLAEPESYVGTGVMVEGLARECADGSCWMKLPSGDTAEVRILTPDFSVPDTVSGRRLVVHGRLTAAADTSMAGNSKTVEGPAATSNDQSDDTTDYRPPTIHYLLHATGVMVEKVRP